MMRVEELVHELKEKITHLETELAEVKEKVAALPEKVDGDGGVFMPEYGEDYWYISADGMTFMDNWEDDSVNCDQYAIGNCFPTEQAAEDAVRVLKLIQKARESQDGYVPDWKDFEQYKCFVYFDSGEIRILIHDYKDVAPIFGYWEDELVCEQFIDENRDELRWFFTEYQR